MGTRQFGPGIGAKSWMHIMYETTYGRLVPGRIIGQAYTPGGETEMVIPFSSESIQHNIGTLESATLDPSRGVSDIIRGSSDVGGDVSFDMRPVGYGNLIKHAMGDGASGSANYVTSSFARGDLGVQLDGVHNIADVDLYVRGEREIVEDWAAELAAGATGIVIVYRNSSGNLAVEALTAAAVTPTGLSGDPVYTHEITLDALTPLAAAHKDGEWCFPQGAARYANTTLHYIELGADLPIGLNVDVIRDIALFVYSGMKVGTWTMNFNAGEIVNGTFGLVGKEEFCGGVLTAEIANALGNGARTLYCSDLRIFNMHPLDAGGASHGHVMVGHEGYITYSALVPPLAINMDNDGAWYDSPIAGEITTTGDADGRLIEGMDQLGDGVILPWTNWTTNRDRWGYYIGQPVVPQSCRANGGVNFVDLKAGLGTTTAIPPYSFFEANILMVSDLVNNTPVLAARTGSKGCELIEVMSASFTLDNGLYTEKYALGSRFRVKVIEQKRSVTGTLSFEFDNLNQYRKFFDGRTFGFMIKCVSTDESRGYIDNGTTARVPYSTCFYFHKCRYTGVTPNAAGPDMIMTDMPFQALVDNGSSTAKAFTEMAVWMTNARAHQYWA